MNERYLFRAKRIDNGEWVEGNYVHTNLGREMIADGTTYFGINRPCMIDIDVNTICQCTGFKDNDGKLIWENDIVVTVYDGNQNPNYVVIWDKDDLGFLATNGKDHYETNFEYLGCCEEITVVGNIFDNPQLIKQEAYDEEV